jgi:hypothetical protein
MKFVNYLLFIFTSVLLFACAKEEKFNNTDTRVGISRVTNFPVMTMAGNPIMSVVQGTTFTDPGVTATEAGKDIPVTVGGTVNTSAIGLYRLSYTSINKDSFPASLERIVFVIPSAETPGVDLSGEYLPIGGAPANAQVTKVAPGVYYSTNIWGGGSQAVIPAYFISSNGTSLIVPLQNLNNGAGRIRSEAPGAYVNGTITWTINRLDFTGGPLIVQKQWRKL